MSRPVPGEIFRTKGGAVLAFIPVEFQKPLWLLLLLLVIPALIVSIRSIGGLSRRKALVTFALRTLVIVLLAVAMADPLWARQGEGVTAIVILDRSQSVPNRLKNWSEDFLDAAARIKESREDGVAVITVAHDSEIAQLPHHESQVKATNEPADLEATNLSSAIDLALALDLKNTAPRIVLASDGNETDGEILESIEALVATGVPVDVLILEYEHEAEVVFDALVAPTLVRIGQSAQIKMELHSQSDATGRLSVKLNDRLLDLNGSEPGMSVPIILKQGVPRVEVFTMSFDEAGRQRIEAVFEPDDPAMDQVVANNRAEAVTFVSGQGQVLIIDSSDAETEHIVNALAQSDLTVRRASPGEVTDIVMLSSYDAVILANVPRWAFNDQQDMALHRYVYDIGGGLIMLGGDDSFGAGQWNGSRVADAMPVDMEPPQTRQMPRGALALIMHSCEIPQGLGWGKDVAKAAINVLSSRDLVGIVEFSWGMGGINGNQWRLPLSELGNKQQALVAVDQMQVGDMPDFDSSMQLAFNGLQNVTAGQKHAIIISDGDPQSPKQQLLKDFASSKISVTTVMVSGHGGAVGTNRMKKIASDTGGRFYQVVNPKNLPKIFIKEAQLVSRSLIQDSEMYQPQLVSRLPGPTRGLDSFPQIGGYVLTAAREGLAQQPLVVRTTEGDDPLLAHWNYGTGKALAYTSDLSGRWGGSVVSWSQYRNMVEQWIRWVMRPSSPANVNVMSRIEGDIAVVEVEALGELDQRKLNLLNITRSNVINPDGTLDTFELQQIAAGRYRGEFPVRDAGAYLIDIGYKGSAEDSKLEGSEQAAVTVPYSREYRAVQHNAFLLRKIAERTGGIVLNDLMNPDGPTDPQLMQMFRRDELTMPKASRVTWHIFAIIAAALFVMDVAARRITVDPAWLRSLKERTLGRRKDASGSTVEAWKKARSQVAHRREAPAKTRFEADEDDRTIAIDVAEDASTGQTVPKPAARRQKTDVQAEDAEDDGDFTSRLLKAKRRAQSTDDEQQDGADG